MTTTRRAATYIEDFNIPANHALWQYDGIRPELYIDTSEGTSLADNVTRAVYNFNTTVAPVLDAKHSAGLKDLSYAIRLIGPDRHGGTDIFLIDHVDDKIGGLVKPGKTAGIAQSRAYMLQQAPLLNAGLAAACAGKPYSHRPVRWFTDYENVNPASEYTVFGNGDGWYEAALAHASASTELFDGVNTLAAWHAANSTKIDGSPIPSSPPSSNRNVAANCDVVFRAFSAYKRGMARALWWGLFEPFIAIMGGTAGNWDFTHESKASPDPCYPLNGSYFMGAGAAYPLSFSNPAVTHRPGNLFFSTTFDPDGTPTQANWKAAYSTANPWQAYDLHRKLRTHRVMGASGGRPVIPEHNAGSQDFLDYYPSRAQAIASMVEYYLDAVEAGVEEFVHFCPGMHDDANTEEDVMEFYDQIAANVGDPRTLRQGSMIGVGVGGGIALGT